MSLLWRKYGFLALVCMFFLQTWWVYSDSTGRDLGPLSELGLEGREIWHRHNCQSCHQLYGYGGFLGPDLTNAADHLTEARFKSVLTEGALQMPPFQLEDRERKAVVAFLEQVSQTGVGQLPPLFRFDAEQALDKVIASRVMSAGAPLSDAAQAGRERVREGACLTCHLPNELAAKRGTDMTTLLAKLGPEGIAGIVTNGIPSKGMPPFSFDTEQMDQLVAFLAWMADNAQAVGEGFQTTGAPQTGAVLPWFEYSR